MAHRRELVIGHSVLGRPIEAVHFTPPSYARPRPTALLFGAIHGDEAVSQLMLERLADELIERPARTPTASWPARATTPTTST
jgi:predicted deacylase